MSGIDISNAKVEKDVENYYRANLRRRFKTEIESPFGCDGFMKNGDLRLLMEFKMDMDFSSKTEICKVLTQVLFYMKRFEKYKTSIPNVYVIADKNEVIVENVNALLPYLSWDLDWSTTPSAAHINNNALLIDMINNDNICPFVYDSKEIDFFQLKAQILNKSSDSPFRISVNSHNLPLIFKTFKDGVLNKTKLGANDLANMFIQVLIDPVNNYAHPTKKGILITQNFGNVGIKSAKFESFFAHFKSDYSPLEKEELTSAADRIIEDETRRKQGEFFTPAIWADEAHKMLCESLGDNWKDEYVVWDCASGTCNLTRDYQFRELYCSTLNQCDIDTANAMGYGGIKFQYDFLNDDAADQLGKKVPEGLRKAFSEGRKILFLMNPPYGTANNLGNNIDNKSGMAKTNINEIMNKNKIGLAARQLYAQFLYRMIELQKNNSNIYIGIFSPPLFISGRSYEDFRKIFYNYFSFDNGMLFKAGHFADVKSQWGIGFTIWKNNKTEHDEISFKIKNINEGTFEIEDIGTKIIYPVIDKYYLSKWAKMEDNNIKKILFPHMSSSVNISTKKHMKIENNALGFVVNISNSTYKNTMGVSLFSGIGTQGNAGCGFSISIRNFDRVLSLFAARKLITPDWINCKDEYMVPNEGHPDYQQWVNDCHVYSLFDNASNQSSLRQVEYKEKLWDIKNEFFWMSKNEMMQLANEHHYDSLYHDAKNSSDRHMHKALSTITLSSDAQAVLGAATSLVKASMAMRQIFSEEHPEMHMDSWDAGYAQLKKLWKEHYKEEFKAFRNLWKIFQDRMRPQVYELGFLK